MTGYLEKIDFKGIIKHYNPKYDSTNMVYTLFCAKKVMKEKDLLISYGDIVFNDKVYKK